jgi:hypothetical protein
VGQIKNVEWLRLRNKGAAARLLAAVPAHFPKPVLRHALAARWIPELPSRAVEFYWRAHPLRADRLARALARRSGPPQGWHWSEGESFRTPPAPYRDPRFARGPGHCCICGQPVFRFGWHRDFAGAGRTSRGQWHAPCVAAWKFWNARAAAPARRRGRPPRAAVPGAARAPGPCLARPSHLLGRAEPAGGQPGRPRREVLRRNGRARPPASRGAAPRGANRLIGCIRRCDPANNFTAQRWPGGGRVRE